MNFKEVYQSILNIFSNYLKNKPNDESIISIFSDLDCDIWSDKLPNDIATYLDLKDKIMIYNNESGQFTTEQLKNGLKDFLSMYKIDFGYQTDNFLEYINDLRL